MGWELVVETKTKEHVIPLYTDDEEAALRALEDAKEKMKSVHTVTIAKRLVLDPTQLCSVMLRKSFTAA